MMKMEKDTMIPTQAFNKGTLSRNAKNDVSISYLGLESVKKSDYLPIFVRKWYYNASV